VTKSDVRGKYSGAENISLARFSLIFTTAAIT